MFEFPFDSLSIRKDLDPSLPWFKLMGEGKEDLDVKFILLSSPFRLGMAGNPNSNEAAVLDVCWVGNKPLEVILLFASNGAVKILDNSVGRKKDWEVNIPSTSYRIFSQYKGNWIPMYEVVFRDMGFRLPFSPFQTSVFQWTDLCPLQLHPNSYPIMRAFELVCQYLQLTPTKDLFFTIFIVLRWKEIGDMHGWVSFRQAKKMFDLFAGKMVSFKERFFLVRPRTGITLRSVCWNKIYLKMSL